MRCDAVTHILYAALSMTLSMLAMRQWFQFEERVKDGRLLELPLGGLMRHREPHVLFGLRQCIRQFTHPISLPVYAAVRRLFFDRMQVPSRLTLWCH